MIKDMTTDEIRAEYAKSLPIETLPGERTWVDRISTWEDFLKMGQSVADLLRELFDDYWHEGNYDKYEKEFRSLNPKLFDFLMKVYPKQ